MTVIPVKLGIIGVVNRSQLDITNKKVNSFLLTFSTCFHGKLKVSFCFTQLSYILEEMTIFERSNKKQEDPFLPVYIVNYHCFFMNACNAVHSPPRTSPSF